MAMRSRRGWSARSSSARSGAQTRQVGQHVAVLVLGVLAQEVEAARKKPPNQSAGSASLWRLTLSPSVLVSPLNTSAETTVNAPSTNRAW